jgi:hypothetical protein
MEVKISKKEHVIKTIDIEFPYYFEDDFSDDYDESGLYGKMEEESHDIIHICYSCGEVEEIIVKRVFHNLSQNPKLCEYFEDRYKSTKENYDRVLKRAKEFLDTI